MSDLENLAIKRILRDDDEITPERISDENEFADDMESWFSEQAQRIANNTSLNGEPPGADFWEAERVALAAFLGVFLLLWVNRGIDQSVEILDKVSLGVGDRVNALSEGWARRHAVTLARGLIRTTRELARNRIAVWIRSGSGNIQELFNSLRDAIAQRWRAEMISQTEITRATNQGAQDVANETDGVKLRIWHTRRDERVCPICRPLDGARENKNGVFPGGFTSPPAHPRCRCTVDFEV